MIINVYVDDLRDCPINFVVARTFQEAIHLLETHKVDIISLDYNLGEDLQGNLLPTGFDLVKYICEKELRENKLYIHTDNQTHSSHKGPSPTNNTQRIFINCSVLS